MRTFVVGDIHGHRNRLEALLSQLEPQARPGDSLVFLGDYIDRGPDSRGVVDRILALRQGEWPGPVYTLKGNHEAMLLDALVDGSFHGADLWLTNGGVETIESYTSGRAEPDLFLAALDDHLDFYHSLQTWHEDAHGIYVHAGLKPGQPPEDADEDTLLWIRHEFLTSNARWRKIVVFGHTPQYEPPDRPPYTADRVRWRPLIRPEKIGIDTGCAYGGPLTAIVLPEREIFSAS